MRTALGAARSRLTWMVMRESLRPVATGLVVGLAVALALARTIEQVLFGVRGVDPIAIAGALLVLVGVAAAAAWLPAHRAARADPVDALRAR